MSWTSNAQPSASATPLGDVSHASPTASFTFAASWRAAWMTALPTMSVSREE
ncbi:MAG TPA: hypothetical protein VMK65_09650 [Longimicrobiales bacterium]|nr:hypothetical protein [Longimicrobiales bacterium]